MAKILDEVDMDYGMTVVAQTYNCCVMKMENETGEGIMTQYSVFPGAFIVFNDFHMKNCYSGLRSDDTRYLCIDYCRTGAMEQAFSEGIYYYLGAGDINIDIRRYHAGNAFFPNEHFHGISVGFVVPVAEEQMSKELNNFFVSLEDVQKKFCPEGKPFVMHGNDDICRIFESLYRAPSENRTDFFRIKIFELLLALKNMSDTPSEPKPYFYKSQVDKVKEIEKKIRENLAVSYTVKELAEEFRLSESTLKSCFKAVYGMPVHTYVQNIRIKTAARLLHCGGMTVADAAAAVGYESPGKFAGVFKRIYGVSPKEFKNGNEVCCL